MGFWRKRESLGLIQNTKKKKLIAKDWGGRKVSEWKLTTRKHQGKRVTAKAIYHHSYWRQIRVIRHHLGDGGG